MMMMNCREPDFGPDEPDEEIQSDVDSDQDNISVSTKFRREMRDFIQTCASNRAGHDSGYFATRGTIVSTLPWPVLRVKENGSYIQLPATEANLDSLLGRFRTPNAWRLDGSQIDIVNPHWHPALHQFVVQTIAPALGIDNAADCLRVGLSQVVIHKKDADFITSIYPSTSTKGSFGSLMLQLPSVFIGGEILVYRNHSFFETRFNGGDDVHYLIHYAAYHSDCQLQMLPMESGCRLILLYDLVFTGSGPPPSAPSFPRMQGLFPLLQRWNDPTQNLKPLLVVPLSQRYSEQNVSFNVLQEDDARICRAFRSEVSQGHVRNPPSETRCCCIESNREMRLLFNLKLLDTIGSSKSYDNYRR